MDRRDFFKILSVTSAGALSGCGSQANKLVPLLVPEHEVVPGEEQWHPSVCTECAAGCGTIVRVMEAVRTVQRSGETVRERIAAIKKIEGNPLDPVSGGRLCARGQAAVQSLYHPDRVTGPMKRAGERGKAQFTAVSWDDAIAAAADAIGRERAQAANILILTGPVSGARLLSLQRFAKALGAPAPVVCSLSGFSIERQAAEAVFGWKGLPVYDLANAQAVLGVGADFLAGWASPVYYARQYGQFRQGRSGIRGRLIQAESRLSLTAGSADRWLPLLPGSEPQFLLAVGRLLLDSGAARDAARLPKDILQSFQSADADKLIAACGLSPVRVREAVKELAGSPAPLVLGGASVVHTNSLDAIVASHYVNLMLGNVGKPGGLLPPAPAAIAPAEDHRATEALAKARVVLLDGANPAYLLPRSSGAQDALGRAQSVIAFSGFIDDSAAWADLILPGHHALESDLAVAPAVSPRGGAALAASFVAPLYETRPIEKTLSDLAKKMGLEFDAATAKDVAQPLLSADLNLDRALRQGGVWPEPAAAAEIRASSAPLTASEAVFDGDRASYPLLFQPYPSLQFQDGAGSHLPWMQELPDPASSSIWGLPVELDPRTAGQWKIENGDMVRVESPHGSIEAPAYVHPGAIPGVVSMPIGDGHTHYGRYASGRGANPLSILAPALERSTGQVVTGGTRVRVARVGGRRAWTQFSAPDREERDIGTR